MLFCYCMSCIIFHIFVLHTVELCIYVVVVDVLHCILQFSILIMTSFFQGSLAGLEELAAVGSMAPNGSMPAVNIPSFNNGVYVNPFDPTRKQRRAPQYHQQVHHRGECVTPKGTLTPSPQGSPHSRRVRIGGRRSVSSDVELADFESDFSAANRDAYHEELSAPKHRRARVSQVKRRYKHKVFDWLFDSSNTTFLLSLGIKKNKRIFFCGRQLTKKYLGH